MIVKNKIYSYLYLLFSIITIILNNLFLQNINREYSVVLLIFFVVLFGLPHGALDTLTAKKNNLLNNFYKFTSFHLIYLLIILLFFCFWFYFPLAGLSFFLIISIIHFSEDWKPELNFFERLVMGTSLISSTVFFQHDDINSIFFALTYTSEVSIIISFFNYIFYLLIFCLLIIILQNFKKYYIILNIVTILTTAVILNPLLYFMCYFCFHHSIKNYKDSIDNLDLVGKAKTIKILIINLLFTLFLSFIIFIFFLKGSLEYRLLQITFIGLAALTVPHMLLKAYINYKK